MKLSTSTIAAAFLLLGAVAILHARKDRDQVEELVATPDEEAIAELVERGVPLRVEGDMVRVEMGGLLMQVRFLNEVDRRTFYQLHSRLPIDPFPPLEVFPEGFTVFEVSFLNNSSEEFQFLPGMASILRGKPGSGDKEMGASNIGDLYSYFRTVFDGKEALIDRAMEVLYFRTLYLEPGERTTKLLVFEGLPKRTRRFVLRVDFLFLGTDSRDIGIPFSTEKIVRPERAGFSGAGER